MDLPTTVEVVKESPLQEILGTILKGVASLVSLGVGWLVTQACLYLKTKKNIDVSAQVKKAILDAAAMGIARGEEWGKQQLKKIDALIAKGDTAAAEALTLPTGEAKQQVAKETASLISPEFRALDDVAKGAIMDAKLFQLRQVSLLPAVPTGLSARPSAHPATVLDLSGRAGTVPKASPVQTIADMVSDSIKEGA